MGIRITDEHKYFNDSGVEYQGITSLISRYKQPFDSFKVATRYAEKHGQTAQYWMEQWDKNRDLACDRGHHFHSYKENQSHGRGVDVVHGQVRMVRNQSFYREQRSLFNLPDGMYPELMMWDDGYRLAGTADKVHIETAGTYRYIDMDDYKTNLSIDDTSYQFADGSFKMMQFPLNHIMDCNLYHYELQLSFYMFVLERHGFTPRSMMITHYPPPEQGPEKRVTDVVKRDKVVPYILEYRKREVIAVINHFNKQRYDSSKR